MQIKVINGVIVEKARTKETQLIEKAIEQVLSFFKTGKPNFRIVFLDNRNEMNKIVGHCTEEWVAGGVFENKTIHIFFPDVFDKVSCHSKLDFYPILVHEITHLITDDLFGFLFPLWLNEGIAYVVANQDISNRSKIQRNKGAPPFDIRNAHSLYEWNEALPYLSSGRFVRHILNQYGKEMLFRLMKLLDRCNDKQEFRKKFNVLYPDRFDTIVDKWLLNIA